MTLMEAERLMKANRADFRAEKQGIRWYWSDVRRAWLGMQADGRGGWTVRQVAGEHCNC